jgi:flagellar basal-body rod protein FlgG
MILTLPLTAKGFFTVAVPSEIGGWTERYTRNGSFQLGKEGFLETKEGYPVLGENGFIRVHANNFKVDNDGTVWINAEYADDPRVMVSREDNTWGQTVLLDTLKIVDFLSERYLKKQGSSLYLDTYASGPALIMEGSLRPKVIQGFTEAANVEPVREMVQMIEINRAYEANQKVIQTHDSMLGVLINQVAKI